MPRVGLRTPGKPTVFPCFPPRENRMFSRPLSRSNPTRGAEYEKTSLSGCPFSQAPRVGFEPTTNSLHIVPKFLKGVDYIIILCDGQMGCEVLRLDGESGYSFRIVSEPSRRLLSGLGC